MDGEQGNASGAGRHQQTDVVGHFSVMVRILRLDPDLELPEPAVHGDAGMDLRACHGVTLAPGGGRAVVPVGFALALPFGYGGFVLPRSGLAARHGVTVVNAPGLIDSGYRGEVMVPLLNTDPTEPFVVSRGDRIAQLVIMAVASVAWTVVDDVAALGETDRGIGGFGHSGR
jgi:dUTP pyrophosphatase